MGCGNLYDELCSFSNLELAYRKARKCKRSKPAVQKFELCLERNLLRLKDELEIGTYSPRPLKRFVIHDPKTRLISASDFRDRVVHHALCNIIQSIFEKSFIHDSYANRIGKGTTKAMERFDLFKRRVSRNGTLVNNAKDSGMVSGFVLKADIRHYFDSVDHGVLLSIIRKKIKDERIIGLIKKILENHRTYFPGKGMPLGNLTSQFFANIYLNELDYFVKHRLKVKCYIRYVDDFVIMDKSNKILGMHKKRIESFLVTLGLQLHSQKSQIYPLHKGTVFLGFRIFYHHKLLSRKNLRRISHMIDSFKEGYSGREMSPDEINHSLVSWFGYARQADTYKLRSKIRKEIENFQKRPEVRHNYINTSP